MRSLDFFIAATLSVLNCLHLPDFHRSWVEQGFITAGQFQLSVLQEPEFLRLDTLPAPLEQRVRERYTEHLAWLEAQPGTEASAVMWRSALRFLDQHRRTEQNPTFRSWCARLDALRQQQTRDVFPELELECWAIRD